MNKFNKFIFFRSLALLVEEAHRAKHKMHMIAVAIGIHTDR